MSNPPEGTKPWRKGWRKRWREDSSFRSLSPIAKVVVFWVEENANDQGRVVTTMRHLALMVGGRDHRVKVPRMTVWRAVREACAAGILRTEAGQQALQGELQPPTIITRCNFEEYQSQVDIDQDATVTGLGAEAGRSSRGMQKKQKKKDPPASRRSDPELEGVQAGFLVAYQQAMGEGMPWTGPDWGVLQRLRKLGVGDTEILRRWNRFLRWKEFYPEKNMHAFAKAFAGKYLREQDRRDPGDNVITFIG